MRDIEKQRAAWRKWYHKDPKRADKYVRARQDRIRSWYKEYKKGLSCSKCGFKHEAVICFHHIDGNDKSFTISNLQTRCSWKKLKTEIAKCVPLCANCHLITHWEHRHLSTSEIPYVQKTPKERIVKTKIAWPTKEQLEILVWQKPTMQIAKELGVSDNAVAKACKRYKIQKPARGYWTKKKHENK